MADVAVTTTNVVKLVKNVVQTLPAGQSVGVGDVAVLTPQAGQVLFTNSSSVGSQFNGGYMLVRLLESGSQTDTTATVKAGVNTGTPYNHSVYGDLTAITFSNGQDRVLQVDLGRHQQEDGTVRISIAGTAGGAVTLSVLQLDPLA